ncbi:lytic transglycosylase, partial [Nocardia beijingensis]
GGLDLRDPAQELRAVLRYNNSMAYAANVLSWSRAYRTGGSPAQVRVSPDLVAPGSLPPVGPGTDMTAVRTTTPTTDPAEQYRAPRPRPQPTQVMITLPGLPPIPCGVFCPTPPPVNPCVGQSVPAPMPFPDLPGTARVPLAPQQPYGAAPAEPRNSDPALAGKPAEPGAAAQPGTVAQPGAAGQPGTQDQLAAGCGQPDTTLATAEPTPLPADLPARDDESRRESEAVTTTPPAPQPESAPAAEPTPPPPPGITLPFGIVIPLPPPPAAPQQ